MFRVFNCLTVEHDWRLVTMAGAVCFLASLAAINLFHHARASRGRARMAWTVTAGAATGCGIWATHFIAMLSYEPGVPIGYDIFLTALSLVAAITVTSGGLALVIYRPATWSAAVAGMIVGLGVASMHYIGMWAVQVPGHISWSLDLVSGSILLGMAFAATAMAIALRHDGLVATLGTGLLLALAILSHHFTAMGALEILPDPTRVVEPSSLSPLSLAFAVANAAIAVLGMSLVSAVLDRRVREQDRRLRIAVNNMPQGLVMFDSSERMIVCNDRYMEMYGLSGDIVKVGCTLREVIANRIATGSLTREAEEYRDALLATMAGGEVMNFVVETANGKAISIVNKPVSGGAWMGIHEDITDRRRAERELERTKNFLDTVIENVPVSVVVRDVKERRFVFVNRAAEKLFGMPRAEIIGRDLHDIFPQNEADVLAARDQETLRSGKPLFVDDHPVHTPSGARLVNSKRLAVNDRTGTAQYLISVIEDVTERTRAQARIEHLAHHDMLTDLPNRSAFNECLAATLESATPTKQPFALLCLNVDRFKQVNDVFGHAAGDTMLRELSQRLVAAAQGAFLARHGGDEFVLLATGPQPATAEELAKRLQATAADDFELAGQSVRLGFSIGVALFPADGSDSSTLLANADAALFRAKAEDRGSIRFFEPAMDKRLRDRRVLQHELGMALSRDELVLHYQPQARTGGTVIGFEALVRWNHPKRGLIGPMTFIPAAEDNGLIVPIGEWVLREACREAASWPDPLQIAVNLSPVQFRHGDLANMVHSILLETGLTPSRLELEITEGVLIGDFSRATSILRRLKALGVRIAMDDFGTGYSSLSYLQSFPFDKIKIDQTFIAKVDGNPQSAAIIRAVIALSRGLDLAVMAEGVETEAQRRFLAQESCDQMQGFLVGRPRPIGEYAALVGYPESGRQSAAAI